jgi:predicted dehydrogenase
VKIRHRLLPGKRCSMPEIAAAVVGTGFIGVVHVEALRRLGIPVLGVVGSSVERARAKADAMGIPVYASFEDMLADPRVTVVHITTPNYLHFPQVKAAIAAGKHVVCEKPLAMTSAESAELLRLAAEAGIIHAVNFNIRFYPLCQHARALVQAGEIGAPRIIQGSYLQDWLMLPTDWNWRLEPALGGELRAVADIGSHWLDLTTFITGEKVSAVMADLATFIPVRRKPTRPIDTFHRQRGDRYRDDRSTYPHRRLCEHPAALRKRCTRRPDGVAGQSGAQKPAEFRDRWRAFGAGVGFGAP